MDVEKARLRKLGLRNLKWLHDHPTLKEQKEREISQSLFNDPCWEKAQTIAITKPLDFEFNTHILLSKGWSEGKKMLMPIATKDRKLTFHLVEPETIFEKTAFGVEEPVAAPEVSAEIIDLLVVPGIVFTHEGFRIGFGGGYYDRFLQQYQGETCSLVFSEQIQESWQVESFDLPVKRLFIS
nr:5-formyltetrahydrofolate cyclo-ligase [Enterococcus sp. DIV0869a]